MTIPPVALVTGAGSGIGRAVCLRLADLGYRLALAGRTETKLQSTLDLIAESVADPHEALLLPADLADAAQAIGAVDLTVEQWGRLDALVNNAGVVQLRPLEDTDEDLLYQTFAANVFGPAVMIARSWPALTRHRGCVVNVSSMAVADPFPGLGVYAASKCGLDSLTRSIAIEGREHGLRAWSVAPGAVETPMLRGMFGRDALPPEQTLDPDDVASVIVACIRGERDEPSGSTIFMSRES